MKKQLIIILLFIVFVPLAAHKSWTFHAQDMYEVLQLEDNPLLTSWMKYISSDLIDGYDAVKAYTIEGKEEWLNTIKPENSENIIREFNDKKYLYCETTGDGYRIGHIKENDSIQDFKTIVEIKA